MNLDNSHLVAFVVRVFVERDQPRFVALNKLNQLRDPLALLL